MPHAVLTFAANVLRVTGWLVLLSVIFVPLERLFSPLPRAARRARLGQDLGYFFISSLVPNLLLSLPLSLVAWSAHSVTPSAYSAAIAGLPLWARMLAALAVGEVGFYWGHRWSHEAPLLWRFHAVHHSPEAVDWLVNTRAHPIDMTFTRLCGFAPLYALGLAAPVGKDASFVPLFVLFVSVVWGYFIHANVRWRLGPLEHLVTSPAFHHWHHSRSVQPNHNYAAMLPWLDRLFGTHHLPPRDWPADYGVDKPQPPTLAGQLVGPFVPN